MAWAPDYVAVSDLAAYLRIDDSLDDAELAVAITAASRAVDHFCGRQFGRTDSPVERVYTARRDYQTGWWTVDVDDLAEPPVTVKVAGDPVTSYTLGPRNAAQNGRPWTRIEFDAGSERLPTGSPGEVSVTGTWGWDAVPATVQQATLLQAARLFKRRDAPFGIAGSPESGSEMRLLARVDPDLQVSLYPYRRMRAVG